MQTYTLLQRLSGLGLEKMLLYGWMVFVTSAELCICQVWWDLVVQVLLHLFQPSEVSLPLLQERELWMNVFSWGGSSSV